jgi:DNA replication protein DnaC
MLAHPTLDHLHALGLYGLAKGFKELEHRPEARGLDHAEWLGLLLEYELTLRRQKQFETRARVARLRHSASVEDVNYQSPRGLDRALFLKLAACDWIAERRNLLITGASGLGKSWLACALGHKACRENMSVLYTRMPRLFADLAIAHGDARYARLLRSLARVKLLILDDWGPEALTPDQARDLLEIVEDRYDKGSLIITSQVPVDRWHDLIGVPTLADAILDRLSHRTGRREPAQATVIPLNPARAQSQIRPTLGAQGRGQRRATLRRNGKRAPPVVAHRHTIQPSHAEPSSHFAEAQIHDRLTNPAKQNIITSIRGSRRPVADFKSEPRPASNRNRWPASYWNAWPASSVSALLRGDRR